VEMPSPGGRPVMKEVQTEAKRRKVELLIVPTEQAIELLKQNPPETNAILHVTRCPASTHKPYHTYPRAGLPWISAAAADGMRFCDAVPVVLQFEYGWSATIAQSVDRNDRRQRRAGQSGPNLPLPRLASKNRTQTRGTRQPKTLCLSCFSGLRQPQERPKKA
jgi:hypothetical protein